MSSGSVCQLKDVQYLPSLTLSELACSSHDSSSDASKRRRLSELSRVIAPAVSSRVSVFGDPGPTASSSSTDRADMVSAGVRDRPSRPAPPLDAPAPAVSQVSAQAASLRPERVPRRKRQFFDQALRAQLCHLHPCQGEADRGGQESAEAPKVGKIPRRPPGDIREEEEPSRSRPCKTRYLHGDGFGDRRPSCA